MITHVGNVSIYVRDQQKAVEFYRDKLGFEVLRDEPMGPSAELSSSTWRRSSRGAE